MGGLHDVLSVPRPLAPIWRRPDEILSIANTFRDHVVLRCSYSRPIDSTTTFMAFVTVKPLQTFRGGVGGLHEVGVL